MHLPDLYDSDQPSKALGDGGSDATEEGRRGRWQCRAEARTWGTAGRSPDAVRATKKSSTPVASGTTAEKGRDQDKATTQLTKTR